MCEYRGKLYISGDFTSKAAPPGNSRNLFAWDGRGFSTFDSVDSQPTLATDGQSLYALGNINGKSGEVVVWDGEHWKTLPISGNHTFYAMTIHKGDLYLIGGEVNTVEGKPAYQLVRYSTSTGSIAMTKMNTAFREGKAFIDFGQSGFLPKELEGWLRYELTGRQIQFRKAKNPQPIAHLRH
jgi:hypothetical protein